MNFTHMIKSDHLISANFVALLCKIVVMIEFDFGPIFEYGLKL